MSGGLATENVASILIFVEDLNVASNEKVGE
jgi:hypothetical protein